MFRLIVFISFIFGVSTRGVPVADDINNGKVIEPKSTGTDSDNRPSKHVTPLECEDCNKANGQGASITHAEQDGTIDDPNDSPDSTKTESNKNAKPFLTFHRIKVKVNKEDKTGPKPSRKGRERHHHRKSNVRNSQRYEQLQLQSHAARGQTTSNVKLSTASETLGPMDKSRESDIEVKVSNKKYYTHSEQKNPKVTPGQTLTPTEKPTNDELDKDEKKVKQSTLHNDAKHVQTEQSSDKETKETKQSEKKNVPLDKSIAISNDFSDGIKLSDDKVHNKNADKTTKLDDIFDDNKLYEQDPKGHPIVKSKGNKDNVKDTNRNEEKDRLFVDIDVENTLGEKVLTGQTDIKTVDEKHQVHPVTSTPKYRKGSVNDVTTNPKDEKKSIDYVIPKKTDDRWSREGLNQVPDVERLERRLHPTVEAPVHDIIQSMRNMVKLIRSGLTRVDDDYKMIHNTTRWKYMTGVRDQLGEIARENDEIYDVVLEASLLTKEIYRKAQERKHPRVNVDAMAVSYRSRLNTNMHSQINTNYYLAQRELDIANQLLEQIKAGRKQRDSLYDDRIRVYHLVRDRLPLRSLHDLYRRADQTINILNAARPLTRSGDRALLYAHMKNDTNLNMRDAKGLLVEGFDLLHHAKRVLMENQAKVQKHRHIIRSRLPADTVADMPIDGFTSMDLFVAWDTTNHHASRLSDRAAEIHMKLVPLTGKAKEAMASRKNVGFKKLLDESVTTMKDTVKDLMVVLDEIRLMLGDEAVFTERCEVLQGARFFTETPIDCDNYIVIDESSGDGDIGSGDFEDTLIDMEITKNVSLSNDTNGESSVDIDITGMKENKKTEVANENKTVEIASNQTKSPIAASSLDEIDDEDRVAELKLKNAKKTSPVTTQQPQSTTTSTPSSHGSTKGPDEDMFFDLFRWFEDGPDVDEIVIDPEGDIELSSVLENKTFNELIRERLYNYSEGSKELLQVAETADTRMKEVSLTWQKVHRRFSTLENKTWSAVSVMSKWKAERSYFNAVHDRVENANEDINLRKDVVEGQCNDAVERANKKLETMTTVYEKQSEKSKNAADPSTVQEAVSQVKVSVDNVNEISRLKQLYPSPCGRLEGLDKKIRSNITELRQKIERAKLIASSLQIAVAVPKKDYLEFPISKEVQEAQPLTSEVQMMLKHSGSDGRLVSLHIGQYESLSLEVKDEALTVVQSIDGNEKSLSLYEDNIQDQWYLIQLQRYAASYNVTMFGDKGILGKVGTGTSADDYRAMTTELLPTTLRLGASEDLTACALGLEINGRSINIFDMPENESIPTPCSTQGRWVSHDPHLLLDGSGYAFISLSDLPSVRTLQSVKVAFNSRSDGTVIFLQPRRMPTIDVYVDKGYLMVYVSYRNFETKLKSTMQVYSTDQVLEIIFKNQRTSSADAVLNGKSNVFKAVKGKKRDLNTKTEDILIGGFPKENSSMVGCLKSLEFNGETVPFYHLHKAKGISFGTCHKTRCVKFDDNSFPIEMENLTSVQSIYIAVERGSLGPVLTFSKHKEKFNLIVSLNTEGVSIEETVQEATEDISLYEDTEYIVISIQDDIDSESVKVHVGDDTEEFSYKKGGGWTGPWGGNGGDKKDDGPVSYTISLGNSSDAPPFVGTIQNVLIDGRPVDLMRFVDTNNLGRCTVDPVPRKLDISDSHHKTFTCK